MTESGPTSLADLKLGVTLPGDKDGDTNLEALIIQKPEWYDEEQFRRGQQFFKSYRSSILFSYLCAIMVGFTVNQLTSALVFTGRSVGPANARKRYLNTLVYLLRWHEGGDIFDPHSVAGSAILKIRLWHHHVRVAMWKNGHEENEKLPINQYDMSLVQSGFIGPILIQPREMGINASEEQLEDYVYFWRVIGWCLGIRDEYNMCGNNKEVATVISRQVEKEIIVPGLREPSAHFKLLCSDFVEGMKAVIPGFNQPGLYMYLFPIMGLPPPRVSGWEWLFYWKVVITCWCNYHIAPFRWLLNYLAEYGMKFML